MGIPGHGGRRPKPTALKVIEGNRGKRPMNEHEPKPEPEIPKPPAHLLKEARREWKRITEDLAGLNMITRLDRAALEFYCLNYGVYVEANKELRRMESQKKSIALTKGPNGVPYLNPFLKVAQDALDKMRKILPELGLTPSSRSRIATPGGSEDNPDDWLDD